MFSHCGYRKHAFRIPNFIRWGENNDCVCRCPVRGRGEVFFLFFSLQMLSYESFRSFRICFFWAVPEEYWSFWILEIVFGGCALWMHIALPFQSVGVTGMHSMRAWQLILLQYLDQSYVFIMECSSALDLEIIEYSYALVSSHWDSKILLCHLLCSSQDTTWAFLYEQCPGFSQFQTMTVPGIIPSSSKQLAYRNVESKCVLRPHL